MRVAQLKERFPDELQGGKFGVVRGENEVMEKDILRYNKLKKEDCIIFVCNQWLPGNNQRFVDYVNNNIEDITISKA